MTLVIADTKQQADFYAREVGLDPRRLGFVHDAARDLAGRDRNLTVVAYGPMDSIRSAVALRMAQSLGFAINRIRRLA